jgi:hypothetical protein
VGAFGSDASFLSWRYGGRMTLWWGSFAIFTAVDQTTFSGSTNGKDFKASYLRVAPGLCTNVGSQTKESTLLMCAAPAYPMDDKHTGAMGEIRMGIGMADIEIEGWETPAGPTVMKGTQREMDWAVLASFGFRIPW